MKRHIHPFALIAPALLLLAAAPPPAPAPSEIVATAPAADWVTIAASDLLVIDLAPDRDGNKRRVVIQLMPPPFSQGWVGNIRRLAAAHWWSGTSINRVQDNYVVQWGDANAEDKAKAKPLPQSLAKIQETEYTGRPTKVAMPSWWRAGHHFPYSVGYGDVDPPRAYPEAPKVDDVFSSAYGFVQGMPLAVKTADERVGDIGTIAPTEAWPVHCYGMVGVGRDMPPDTGTGAELYTVIGHAPRHLDRNIALVGRVIAGIEHLSSLPRGTGPLGFYEKPEQRVTITSIRLGTEVAELPAYQYLSTESATFSRYANARANRRDPFFIRPAGGADICNVPVPIRERP